jgi:phosphatidylserine decarboxylase
MQFFYPAKLSAFNCRKEEHLVINFLKTLPQYFIPKSLLSSLLGKLANQSISHQTIIKWFVKSYGVDMSEALHTNINHYKSFNDFFIRELAPNARPINTTPHIMASPVDGCVSQLGAIKSGRIVQAKGRDYSILELLGGLKKQEKLFLEGNFITLYLSPKDYHRVHMPIDGKLLSMTYIPGTLFAVKPCTAESVSNLFARNERLAMLFETNKGPLAVIMVGAMIVGNMATVWQGTLPRTKKIQEWHYPNEQVTDVNFKKGQELGHFKLGSTVILLSGKNFAHHWRASLGPNSSIKMGQQLSE